MNELEIINLCKTYSTKKLPISNDFSINVFENLDISSKNLSVIPLRFRKCIWGF